MATNTRFIRSISASMVALLKRICAILNPKV